MSASRSHSPPLMGYSALASGQSHRCEEAPADKLGCPPSLSGSTGQATRSSDLVWSSLQGVSGKLSTRTRLRRALTTCTCSRREAVCPSSYLSTMSPSSRVPTALPSGECLYCFFRSLRVKTLPLRFMILRHVYGRPASWTTAFRFGPHVLVKRCNSDATFEAGTMQFVAAHTSVPVPKVYDVFSWRGATWIVMEFVPGVSLDRIWHRLTASQKSNIKAELKGYIAQLRSVAHPSPGRVEAAFGGPCFDTRLRATAMGPFATVDDFHKFLNHDYVRSAEAHRDVWPDFEKCQGRTYPTVLSHGDISPRNIMVRDNSIISIIDWETAGWYPEYWEYVTMCTAHSAHEGVDEFAVDLMDGYPDELRIHCHLLSMFNGW